MYRSYPILLSLLSSAFLLLRTFPSLLCRYRYVFLSSEHKLNLLSSAGFWGHLQELASLLWFISGVVRRSQSFCFSVVKFVIPAYIFDLSRPADCSQTTNTHSGPENQNCSFFTRAELHPKLLADSGYLWLPFGGEAMKAVQKLNFCPYVQLNPVFQEEDQVMKMMQECSQHFVTTI